MEFDQFKDEAANYLEDDGIKYSAALDDQLWALYQAGTKPHEVPKKLSGA